MGPRGPPLRELVSARRQHLHRLCLHRGAGPRLRSGSDRVLLDRLCGAGLPHLLRRPSAALASRACVRARHRRRLRRRAVREPDARGSCRGHGNRRDGAVPRAAGLRDRDLHRSARASGGSLARHRLRDARRHHVRRRVALGRPDLGREGRLDLGAVLMAVVYIPLHLGGYEHVLNQVPDSKLELPSNLHLSYTTLALGSALALWLYPHALTGTFSAKSGDVIRRNSFLLPIYTVMLLLLALLGYMAIAAAVRPSGSYGANVIVHALFEQTLPAALAGFALAASAIGGLVPAQVMSIAAANLFSRNVYKSFIKPDAREREVTKVSKLTSLVVKLGAVAFIFAVPATYVANFQLAGGVWILQTLPAVFLALFVRTLGRCAILVGWALGIAWGTAMLADTGFNDATYHFGILGDQRVYIGLPSLALNLVVVVAGTALASFARRAR